MSSLIVGASTGLGRALANELARRGENLKLIARDQLDLDAIAADLRLRYQIRVETLAFALTTESTDLLATFFQVQPHKIFLIAGYSLRKSVSSLSQLEIDEHIQVNFAGPIRLVEMVLKLKPEYQKSLKIVMASSVGVVRPRSMGGLYCAAKAGLEFYLTALQQNTASTLECKIARIGYMKTAMTRGQKLLFPSVTPEWAAYQIANLSDSKQSLVYLPGWWRLIGIVINLVPKMLFRRLKT